VKAKRNKSSTQHDQDMPHCETKVKGQAKTKEGVCVGGGGTKGQAKTKEGGVGGGRSKDKGASQDKEGEEGRGPTGVGAI
jgi:hypothetical protein